jgi:hypothetical protein
MSDAPDTIPLDSQPVPARNDGRDEPRGLDGPPIEAFRFVSYDFDEATATASFRYAFDDRFHFVEKLIFDGAFPPLDEERRTALDLCLHSLHLILGISYFKAAIVREGLTPRLVVETEAMPKEAAAFFSKTYFHGLGEFAYVNGIDLRDKIQFPFSRSSSLRASPLKLPRRTIVPVGGGKDSVVSIELLRETAEPLALFSLGEHRPNRNVAAASGFPLITVQRQIDPLLFKLNSAGALNGHVPFSAMLSLILPAVGVLYGFDVAALSNESSANTGNLRWNDLAVNHQYSKGLEFERDVSNYIRRYVLENFHYFSLLRPLSDLHIGKIFSRYKAYHPVFVSCNRAFRIKEGSPGGKWCLECAKCHFVFLALAPFMTKAEMLAIFGTDLLDDPRWAVSYDKLLGRVEHRPLDCVGEADECTAAFILLTRHDEFSGDFLVQRFAREVLPSLEDPEALVRAALTPSREHGVPAPYYACVSKNF